MIDYQASPNAAHVEAIADALHITDPKQRLMVRLLCRQGSDSDLVARAKRCAGVCRRHGIPREHYLTVFLYLERKAWEEKP